MPDSALPPHIEETVQAVEQIHLQHRDEASRADGLLDRTKAQISRPRFIVILFAVLTGWALLNLTMPRQFRPDPAPFLYMQLVLSFGAVLLTILILATQRRADRLASHREKLILQLAFVSEQKTAKLIELVEELRRDIPHVPDRHDIEAEQMTKKVDAGAIADALREDDPQSS